MSLEPGDKYRLWEIFNSLASPEKISILTSVMNASDEHEMNVYFNLLGKACFLRAKMKASEDMSFTFSLMVYFNIMMRYEPSLHLWYENINILVWFYKVTFPYPNFFITFILVPLMLRGVNLEIKADYNDPEVKVLKYLEEVSEDESPHKEIFASVPEHYTPQHATFLFAKLNNQERRHEIVMLMDEPEFLYEPPTFDLKTEAISMHSFRVYDFMKDVGTDSSCPHHDSLLGLDEYYTSLSYYNYEAFKKNQEQSDLLKESTLIDYLEVIKQEHEPLTNIRDFLLGMLLKDVSVCKHFMDRLPEGWRQSFKEIYRYPRWMFMRESTAMNYCYQLGFNFVSAEDTKTKIENLYNSLKSQPGYRENWLLQFQAQNKAYYKLMHSRFSDLQENDMNLEKLQFANTETISMDNVFLLSRKEVFSYRDENFIYFFDSTSAKNLLDTELNPYTRKPLSKEVLRMATNFVCRYQDWRKDLVSKTVDEILDEIMGGRKFSSSCSCNNKDPVYLLAKELKSRGITDGVLRNVHVTDLVFKLNMMGHSVSREKSMEETYKELLQILKDLPLERKESMKNHICSVITVQRVPLRMEMLGLH